jgi:hypothetical protein
MSDTNEISNGQEESCSCCPACKAEIQRIEEIQDQMNLKLDVLIHFEQRKFEAGGSRIIRESEIIEEELPPLNKITPENFNKLTRPLQETIETLYFLFLNEKEDTGHPENPGFDASQVCTNTGKKRPVESALLNELFRLRYADKVRISRTVRYNLDWSQDLNWTQKQKNRWLIKYQRIKSSGGRRK